MSHEKMEKPDLRRRSLGHYLSFIEKAEVNAILLRRH